jgi:hypothetical protein
MISIKYPSEKRSRLASAARLNPLVQEKISRGKHWNWHGGSSRAPYHPLFDGIFKDSVRACFGYKCFMCGKTQAQNNERLSVHHPDYNKMSDPYDENNIPVPLCRSCHMKTNSGDRDEWLMFFRMGVYLHTGGTMKTHYSIEEMTKYYYKNIKTNEKLDTNLPIASTDKAWITFHKLRGSVYRKHYSR